MPDAEWMNADAGAPSYTASELRRADSVDLSPKGAAGVTPFGATQGPRVGFGTGLVTLVSTTITVKAHAGVISPDLSSTQGPYKYQLNADETHTLTAAHATLSRTDLVYMVVDDDDEDSSGQRRVISGYLAGTAGGGVPSLPARSFELARIAVPPSGGGSPSVTERQRPTVASGGILPVRDATDRDDTSIATPYAGRMDYRLDSNRFEYRGASAWRTLEIVVPCTSGTRPSHQEGLVIYETDTDRLLVSDGTSWVRVGHSTVAGRTGCRLYKATSSVADSSPTPITWGVEDQDTDGFITVPSDTVTIPTGLGGLYAITFRTGGAFSGSGRAFIDITPTSSIANMPAFFRHYMAAAEDEGLISITIPLEAGDFFICQVFHSSGGSVNFESFLSCYRIAR